LLDRLDQDRQQRIQAMRFDAAMRAFSGGGSSASGKKFDRTKGVLVRGAYRKHRGGGSKADAASKMKAHIKYIAGDKHKAEEAEKRQLYDDKGREQTSKEALERHGNPYIEHRVVISPAGQADEKDLHVLAQATIQQIREKNPKAQIEASYAIHTDSRHPHAHVLVTSNNQVRLDREDYAQLRQMNKNIRAELDAERELGREHSHTLDAALGHGQDLQDLSQEQNHEQEMQL